jgi:hypothetical protein
VIRRYVNEVGEEPTIGHLRNSTFSTAARPAAARVFPSSIRAGLDAISLTVTVVMRTQLMPSLSRPAPPGTS